MPTVVLNGCREDNLEQNRHAHCTEKVICNFADSSYMVDFKLLGSFTLQCLALALAGERWRTLELALLRR